MASHFFGHFIHLDAPAHLGCRRDVPHNTDAEKFVVVLRSSPTIIVHQEVCGSRLEAPYGTSQRHVVALAGHQHGLWSAEISSGAPDGIVFS